STRISSKCGGPSERRGTRITSWRWRLPWRWRVAPARQSGRSASRFYRRDDSRQRLIERLRARGRAALMPHANDHQIVRWHDEGVLAARAVHEIRVARQVPLAFAVDPEQAAVLAPPPRRRGRADEGRPAFRQQTLAVPHAVPEIQQSQPRPVA